MKSYFPKEIHHTKDSVNDKSESELILVFVSMLQYNRKHHLVCTMYIE